MKTILRRGSLPLACLCTALALAVFCQGSARAASEPGANQCVSPPSDNAAWWPFFNGTDVVSNVVLTPHNYAGFGAGKVASGAEFLTNSYFTAPVGTLNIGKGAGMSIEGWIRPRTLDQQQAIVEWNNGSGKVGASVFISIDSLGGVGSIFANLPTTNGTDHYWASSPNILRPGSWQHIAVTYDRASGYGRIYLNGTNVASSHLGSYTPQTQYQLNVGRRASGPGAGSHFQGQMDELSLYERALTPEEVRAIYVAGEAGKCPPGVLAPVILQNPWPLAVNEGETARLKVVAVGQAPILYQWFKDGQSFRFTEDGFLDLTNATPSLSGIYSAIVFNNYGRATSDVAMVTIVAAGATCAGFPPSTVAWWPLEGNGVDRMGFDTLIFEGGAAGGMGLVGRALYLPPGNAYARGYPSDRWALKDAITAEGWVKPTAAQTQVILSKWRGLTGYGDDSWKLGLDASGKPSFTISRDGWTVAATAVGTSSVPVNAWSHVAGTYDGSRVNVYVNGVLDSSVPYTNKIHVGISHIGIGASLGASTTNTPADHFTGFIDEPAVYSTALTQPMLKRIYDAWNQGKCGSALAPVIVQQPSDVTAVADSWVQFSGEAWGAAPMDFQWLKDGEPLPDAKGFVLSLPGLSASDQGRYTLFVSNRYGSALSSNAQLTVTATAKECGMFGVTPVAWWPADGVVSDVKSDATTVAFNGVRFGPGKAYQAFVLDGNGAHLRVTNLNLAVVTNLTIEVWVHPNEHRQQTIVSKWNATGITNNNSFNLSLRPDGRVSFLVSRDGDVPSSVLVGATTLPLRRWTHLAVTYDGYVMKLIVNGRPDMTQEFQGGIYWGRADLGIGAQVGFLPGGQFQAPFSGMIDELTFFPHHLDPFEIKYFYDAGSAGKCLDRSPPLVTQQPSPLTVGMGQPFSLTAFVTGTPPLSYQWYRGAEPIVGATTNYHLVQSASAIHQGLYSLRITNRFGLTTSSAVLVTVTNTAPTIIRHPAPVSVALGQTASFDVEAVGGAPMTYRWRKDNITIPGATNHTLIIPTVSGQDAGIYTVQVGNALGVVFSLPAALTITNPPACASVAASVLHWWRGDSNVLDSVGDLNGWSTGVSYVQGKVGQAIYFDGVYDTITNRVPGLTNILDNYTIELWARPVAGRLHTPETAEGLYGTSGQRYAVFPFNGGFGNVGSGISIGTNGVSVFEHGNTYLSSLLVYSGDFKDWFHVAVVYSNRQPSLYINGQWVRTGFRSSRSSFPSTWLGGNNTMPQDYGHYAGSLDEVTIYKGVLAPDQIRAIYNAGALGKCIHPTVLEPVITTGLTNIEAVQGQNVTFSVIATGAPPISYQWYLGSTPLPGATSATYVLTNAQPQFSGPYSVWVTNAFGKAYATANLLVPVSQTIVRISNLTNVPAGQPFSVPIEFVAAGVENALTFTVVFPTNYMRLQGLAVSPAVGGARMFNTNFVATGSLGVGIALDPDHSFARGTSVLGTLQFVASHDITAGTFASIGFGDDLAKREVADVEGNPMSAYFLNGWINFITGFEADVAPRPNGDMRVTSTDWVIVGRLATGRAIPFSATDFMKADCAPRSTFGDGVLSVSDWVQAGRYASGIDPLTIIGGPSSTGRVVAAKQTLQAPRLVKATSAGLKPGTEGHVLVHLSAQGGENAVGFSLRFDPGALTFTKAALADGMNGAVLEMNDADAALGRLGIAAALPTGQTFSPGMVPVARLTFKAGQGSGSTALAFANAPVICEVASVDGEPLASIYNGAVVQVDPRPVLRIEPAGDHLQLRWPAWAAGARIESSQSPIGPWQLSAITPMPSGDEMTAKVPNPAQSTFYRLRQP